MKSNFRKIKQVVFFAHLNVCTAIHGRCVHVMFHIEIGFQREGDVYNRIPYGIGFSIIGSNFWGLGMLLYTGFLSDTLIRT